MTYGDGVADLRRKEIRKHGYGIQSVPGDEGIPPYSYTLGCSLTWGRPELLVVGLIPAYCALLLKGVVSRFYRQQRPIPDDTPIDVALPGEDVEIDVWVRPCEEEQVRRLTRLHGVLGMADAPVQQIVWPDTNGCYPWQCRTTGMYLQQQPLYCRPPIPEHL